MLMCPKRGCCISALSIRPSRTDIRAGSDSASLLPIALTKEIHHQMDLFAGNAFRVFNMRSTAKGGEFPGRFGAF